MISIPTGDTGVPSFLASSALGNLGFLDAITGEDRGLSSMKQWMVRLKAQSMVKQRERVDCVIAEVFPTHNFPYLKLVARPMKNKSLDTQSMSSTKSSVPTESAFLYLGHLSRISME